MPYLIDSIAIARYQHGLGGLEPNLDVSAFYSKVAAITSSDEYFKVGGQPVMENDRINDDTELTVLEVFMNMYVLYIFRGG
jgi:hypothetical protein